MSERIDRAMRIIRNAMSITHEKLPPGISLRHTGQEIMSQEHKIRVLRQLDEQPIKGSILRKKVKTVVKGCLSEVSPIEPDPNLF